MCQQHYNIGKKEAINPFERVKHIRLAEGSQMQVYLKSWLDKRCDEVITRKVGDTWCLFYPIEILDFITIIQWMNPTRGKFYFKGDIVQWKHSVHFNIEEDTLICF